MVIEIFLAFLHFLLIEQAEMPDTAVGKAIDHRTPDVEGYEIVDGSANVGTKSGKQDDKKHIERPTGCMIGCRGDNKLGRNGYHRTLQEH